MTGKPKFHVLAACFMLTAVSAHSATLLTTNTSAPTVNGLDQANTTWTDTVTFKSYTDAGPRGQTFTTGGSGVYINSFSLNSNSATLSARNNVYTLRIGTISVGTFTVISSTTVNQTVDTAAGNWNTFHFDAPILLSANTTYAVDVDMITSNDWSGNIPYYRYNRSDGFAGGNLYEGNNATPTTVTENSARDMVFHIDMTAVPEPSSAAMFGIASLALLMRRRRLK